MKAMQFLFISDLEGNLSVVPFHNLRLCFVELFKTLCFIYNNKYSNADIKSGNMVNIGESLPGEWAPGSCWSRDPGRWM